MEVLANAISALTSMAAMYKVDMESDAHAKATMRALQQAELSIQTLVRSGPSFEHSPAASPAQTSSLSVSVNSGTEDPDEPSAASGADHPPLADNTARYVMSWCAV